ncbi:Dynein light chain 1, cytoplasmic [Zancudomyces culisetae]|uniref:Dynein light chain n=1 Tax=Zancudomyces culisetae TaxID=1213189 RepID=A0A1R1PY07_ZANCU|nr:Dynein light chain 1, cytoplasmic [Zancudomyces culisetae]|eukprot:OMH85819.1 Dynein light chain 1, cytoplasmic [Zancudomyces culisetae]
MADSKITIKSADMEEQLQNEIVEIATAAFTEFKIEKDIASHIKRECDKKFGPTWHAVVGKNFGSYVTHGKSPLAPSVYVSFFLCLYPS